MSRVILLEFFVYFIALFHIIYVLLVNSSLSSINLILKNPVFSTLSPYDGYPQREHKIINNKLVDFTDFKFLINPDICRNYTFLLIIVVSSNPANYERRFAIRETWGKVNDAVKIVFTLGTCGDQKMLADINEESRKFNDIVQGNFVDSYRNLTYKHIMGLKWAAQYCSGARYLLKADDDTFIHRRKLEIFLARELSPWGTKNLIGCIVWKSMPVVRENASKWYVPKEMYFPEEFPIYCSGMFVLYSRDVVPPLVEQSETTNYFFIDDVYVTGILTKQLGLIHTDLESLSLLFPSKKLYPRLLENPTAAVGDFIFGPANVDLDNMRRLWQMITNRRD